MYIHICIYMHTYICIPRTYTYTFICTYISTYICTSNYTSQYIYTYIHMYIYICIYVYVYVYTHMYIYMCPLQTWTCWTTQVLRARELLGPLGLGSGLSQVQDPKGPWNYMVYTWALTGILYPYFGVYVCTMRILVPFGVTLDSRRPDQEGLRADWAAFKELQARYHSQQAFNIW